MKVTIKYFAMLKEQAGKKKKKRSLKPRWKTVSSSTSFCKPSEDSSFRASTCRWQ